MRTVCDRYLRLGDGYGPMTAPQGNGAPAPPSPSTLLFDFDPAWDPYVDRVGGIRLVPSGTAPTPGVANGRQCMVFGGAGSLLSAAPFAALADLTGGVSIYVVCERTDALVSTVGLMAIDDSGDSPSIASSTVAINWNSANTHSTLIYDPAGVLSSDTEPCTRNQVEIVSLHATLTERTARTNGTGTASASATSRAPADMDRMVLGDASVPGFYFTGRIYRVLICEGAYSEDVLTYLAGLYDYSPSAAPDAAFNVLSDWDPSFSYTVDRTAALTYAESGTGISRVKVGGNWCAEFDGAGALVSASAPFAALADLTGGVSIYVVSERTDAGAGQAGLAWIDDNDGTAGNGNQLGIAHRDPNGTLATAYAYDSAGSTTIDSQACTLAGIQVFSGHFTTTAREMRVDGTGAAEASGTTRAPVDLARLTIGAYTLFSAGDPAAGFLTGRVYRVLVCEGAYNADVLTYLQGIY